MPTYETSPAEIVVGPDGAPLATEATLTALLAASGGDAGPGPASTGQHITQSSVRDDGNTNLTTLAAGQTWTGTWVDMTGYSQSVTSFKADQAGTFTLQFSSDEITADSTLGPFTLAANTNNPQTVLPSRKFFRVLYTNTSGSVANLRIETRLYAVPGELTGRLQDSINKLGVAKLVRAVLTGANENATTYSDVHVNPRGLLEAEFKDPIGVNGGMLVAELRPRIQISPQYGAPASDVEALTSLGGTLTATGGAFSVLSGTSQGGYAVTRSRRLINAVPGQGFVLRFTAKFSAVREGSLQAAGALSATELIGFGMGGADGRTPGIFRRIAGAVQIVQATITAVAAGSETITITLDSVPFTVATGGALGTVALVAEKIARNIVPTGWQSVVSLTSNGAVVTFIKAVAGPAAGTYSVTSTGTVTGTVAVLQVGVANDDVTGFRPQTAWTNDRMDGSMGTTNPSGATLNPAVYNEFEMRGSITGPLSTYIRAQDGDYELVDRYIHSGVGTTPLFKNASFRMGWITYNTTNTTSLTVSGTEASAFIEGARSAQRDPWGVVAAAVTLDSTTEYAMICIRVGSIFGGTNNLRELVLRYVNFSTETSNRSILVRAVLNPTLTEPTGWTYLDSASSCVEVAYPTGNGRLFSGGRTIGAGAVGTGGNGRINWDEDEIRLEPGDVVVIGGKGLSGTPVATVSAGGAEG